MKMKHCICIYLVVFSLPFFVAVWDIQEYLFQLIGISSSYNIACFVTWYNRILSPKSYTIYLEALDIHPIWSPAHKHSQSISASTPLGHSPQKKSLSCFEHVYLGVALRPHHQNRDKLSSTNQIVPWDVPDVAYTSLPAYRCCRRKNHIGGSNDHSQDSSSLYSSQHYEIAVMTFVYVDSSILLDPP